MSASKMALTNTHTHTHIHTYSHTYTTINNEFVMYDGTLRNYVLLREADDSNPGSL